MKQSVATPSARRILRVFNIPRPPLWCLNWIRSLLQRGVYLGHHLLGHQLHRAPGELRVEPVVAGIVERAEGTGLLAEGEDLLDHAVDGAGDDELRGHRVGVDRGVGLALIELEEVRAA